MAELNKPYDYRKITGETFEFIIDDGVDTMDSLHRRSHNHTAIAVALLKTVGALSFLGAISAETPTRAVFMIQRTIITFALLSYVAGLICVIYILCASGRRWSAMLFSAITTAFASTKLCAWYVSTLGDLHVIGVFLLGATFAVVLDWVLKNRLWKTT